MSDWINDDELKNILGSVDNDNESEGDVNEHLLEELLLSDTRNAKKSEKGTKPKQKKTPTRKAEQEEDYDIVKEEAEIEEVILEELDDEDYEGEEASLDLLLDIPVEIRVRLGEIEMTIEEIMDLSIGSIIKLENLAGEPVELLIENHVIAKGEIFTMEDKFCVWIKEIVEPKERIHSLKNKLRRQRV